MEKPENSYFVNTGEEKLHSYRKGPLTLYTNHVGPCVTLVRYDKRHVGMYHLWVDLSHISDAKKKIRYVMRGANKDTQLAIIGGMDRPEDMDQRCHFPGAVHNSKMAIDLIKEEVARYKSPIVHEDTMGMHQRKIAIHPNGDMDVSDGWNYKEPYTVNLEELAKQKKVSEAINSWVDKSSDGSKPEGHQIIARGGERTPPEQTRREGRSWSEFLRGKR